MTTRTILALGPKGRSFEGDRRPGPGGRGAGRDRGAEKMETFRIEVGLAHQVKPANIVGAIANETGLDGFHIGRIEIFEEYSTVDLLEGMPPDVFDALKQVAVAGRRLNISRVEQSPVRDDRSSERKFKPKGQFKAKGQFKGKPKRAAARV